MTFRIAGLSILFFLSMLCLINREPHYLHRSFERNPRVKDEAMAVMNQNDDKNKKDPNEQDPFNFFKLSPEPSNNNNNKDQKKPRLPFIAIIAGVLIILLIVNQFLMKQDEYYPFFGV